MLEALHQVVVVSVVLVAQLPVRLEDHHGQVRRVGFLKLRADVQQRPLRRGVVRNHRSGEFFCDVLHLGREGSHRDREEAPEEDDRYRESTHHLGDEWAFDLRFVQAVLAHADFTLHSTSASGWLSEFSASESEGCTPSTSMRQRSGPPCTCTEMLPDATVSVVVSS